MSEVECATDDSREDCDIVCDNEFDCDCVQADPIVRMIEHSDNTNSDDSDVVDDDIDIANCQSEDGNVGWIRQAILNEVSKPGWKEIADKSAESKILWAQWDCLLIKDDVLVRRYEDVVDDTYLLQTIMPFALPKQFVGHVHAGFGGAHLGWTRTEALIRNKAYWLGWTDDVDLFIK